MVVAKTPYMQSSVYRMMLLVGGGFRIAVCACHGRHDDRVLMYVV